MPDGVRREFINKTMDDKPKKKIYKRWWFWIVVVVLTHVVILVVIAVAISAVSISDIKRHTHTIRRPSTTSLGMVRLSNRWANFPV